ncbi:acetylglutamate kinase [Neobacillus sp. YIM B06451]|uniref:acetylglutamate kinase n=1 Tax=Neobacillus sp. YIM B06451 TaxID=3070994 RepID=UPI0029318BA5|nr:acetylglutamate kinase [Neobacillus sp. YIM B06451]
MGFLVIKCGGSIMEDMPQTFYEDIVALKQSGEWSPIIVHGGGPLITSLLAKLDIKTEFAEGLRITSNEVLDVAEMALSGLANKQLVRNIGIAGGRAIGISGTDGGLLEARPAENAGILGFVGEVSNVQTSIIEHLVEGGFIPVISPIGMDGTGQRYNINGDTAAAAVAASLGANLCFISDIPGILVEKEGEKVKLDAATPAEIDGLIASGQIWGGMIPKVKAAVNALNFGVREAAIINGLEPGSLLSYAHGETQGTKITVEQEAIHGN